MPLSARLARVLAGALVAVSATTVSVHAYADDPGTAKKKSDAKVASTQSNLDDTSAALVTASAKLTATTAAVGVAQVALNTKGAALMAAENHKTTVAGDLTAARATEGKNTSALAVTVAARARTKILVGGIARRSYEAGGLGKFALTLQILGSQGPDVADQMSTADLLLRQQNVVLTTLAGQQAAQKAEGVTLSATRRRVAGLKITADNAVLTATTARNDARTAKSTLLTLQKTQTGARNALATQKSAQAASLTAQKAESTRLAGILKARALALATLQNRPVATATAAPATASSRAMSRSGATVGARGNGFFTPPMPLSSIVSVFGMRVNPVTGINTLHEGDDFPFACDTPVLAAADGTVVSAATDSVGGNNLTIDHGYVQGHNLASYYAHLSRFVVRSGAVKRGQLIGYSGTTGRSTGCHLHFGVFDNGTPVDPLIWLQ